MLVLTIDLCFDIYLGLIYLPILRQPLIRSVWRRTGTYYSDFLNDNATPLTSQPFNLWQACLTTSLSMRPTNILSYQIHQQYLTHTIFQLFIKSSITVSVPRELVEVPHENFIVQPSWLFRHPISLCWNICFVLWFFFFVISFWSLMSSMFLFVFKLWMMN